MSRVAQPELQISLATHRLLLEEERARAEAITDEGRAAQKRLEELKLEHDACIQRQSALNQLILYLDELIDAAKPAELPASTLVQLKAKPARIGKQHYRMLHWVKTGPINLGDLAGLSGVIPRRAKHQMAEDVEEGLVTKDVDGFYRITPAGSDLLQRFEDYRKSVNQSLPSLDLSSDEEDQDETDQDVREGQIPLVPDDLSATDDEEE